MAVPVWQPGTLYQPGDIVQPITWPAPSAAQVENGDFTAGNVGWDFTDGAQYATAGGYGGNGACVRMPGNVANGLALNKTKLVVETGKTFTANCMIQQGAAIKGATAGWVVVRWYKADDTFLLEEKGNSVDDGSGGAWHKSTVTATCPSGAAYARVGIYLFSVADHNHPIWGDNLTVSGTFAGLPKGLVYKAVQSESGYSAVSEPAWPPILGQQVIDNEVTWEAVASTRVTWEASPLYVSGETEPDWPTAVDGYVLDGTINWKAVSRRVEDANCPNTKIVSIAASKVYAADDDIIRYSATVNPLDWTSADDAGYLPTGLQNYGANPVAAMGLYRGNLIAFNAEAFQLWQVDEDPASISLLDALPMGSTQHHAIAPVSNDLFFLSSQGVRTVGIAASSTNFQAGDVGMPIDPLVQEIMATGGGPMALYYPAAGQYWLCFQVDGQAHVFVYSMTRIGQVGAWSRYIFPFEIEDWAIKGDDLYLRSGAYVHRVDASVVGDEAAPGVVQLFQGVIQWPWLDLGQPSVTKALYGFDVVGRGTVTVEFGYDQTNGGRFTQPYTVPADTVPGMVIPMPLSAPSLSVRLTYDGSEQWQWNAFQLYLQDMRGMA